MPEHQIVFNLKPEQFEEAQRLARLSGARSVNTFLRDRLLAFLGIELAESISAPATLSQSHTQNPLTEEELSPEQKLSIVKQDLNRIHRELQVFIAESLGSGIYAAEVDYAEEQDEPSLMEQTINAFQQLQEAITADLEEQSRALDTGPGHTTPGGMTQVQISLPQSTRDEESSSTRTGSSGPGSGLARAMEQMQETETVNLTPPASSVFVGPAYIGTTPVVSAGSQRPNNADAQSAADELEELADRAFAISPRLGSLGKPAEPSTNSGGTRKPQGADSSKPLKWAPPPAPSPDDPLADLIDDTIIKQAQELRGAFVGSEGEDTPATATADQSSSWQPAQTPPSADAVLPQPNPADRPDSSAQSRTDAGVTRHDKPAQPINYDALERLLSLHKEQSQEKKEEEQRRVLDDQQGPSPQEVIQSQVPQKDDFAGVARFISEDKSIAQDESYDSQTNEELAETPDDTTSANEKSSAPRAAESQALPGPPPKRVSANSDSDSQGFSGGPPPKKRKK